MNCANSLRKFSFLIFGTVIFLSSCARNDKSFSKITMRWKNVKHASEVLEVNQKLDLVVSNIDSEKKRVSVSLKDFDTSPWENFLNNNKENDTINIHANIHA